MYVCVPKYVYLHNIYAVTTEDIGEHLINRNWGYRQL